MDKIHTLNEIIERMCRHTGCTEVEAANFISAVTQEVADRLKAHQENVEVPELGSFGVDHQGYVIFTPTQEIAAEINEPFSLFESVMLEPGVTAEELACVNVDDDSTEKPAIPHSAEQKAPASQNPEPPQPTIVQPDTDQSSPKTQVAEPAPIVAPEPPIEHAPIEPARTVKPIKQPETVDDPVEQIPHTAVMPEPEAWKDDYAGYPSYSDYPDDKSTNNHRFNPVIAYILGIVTGVIVSCILVYFLYPKLMDKSIDEAYGVSQDEYYDEDSEDFDTSKSDSSVADDPLYQESQPATSQPVSTTPASATTSTAAPATTPTTTTSDGSVVYDTVRPGYFLTKMAKKHYGIQEFWVYIYEENKDRIKNPMKLPAGFEVVIPPAEKYGINPNDAASVEKAKNISHELNKKFN